MTPTCQHAPGFARLFDFPDSRQVAIYFDPSTPSLVIVASSNGIMSNSRLDFGKGPPHPDHAPALAAMLDNITPDIAERVLQALDKAVDGNIKDPALRACLGLLPARQASQAFARLHVPADAPPQLVISERIDEQPCLRVVDPSGTRIVRFPTDRARDAAFVADPATLDPAPGQCAPSRRRAP